MADYEIRIHSGGLWPPHGKALNVYKHSIDSANLRLAVDEQGVMTVFGPVCRDGMLRVERTSGDGNIAIFENNSPRSTLAWIKTNGAGEFPFGSLLLAITNNAPAGGDSGDVLVWNDGGTRRLVANIGGTWYKTAAFA